MLKTTYKFAEVWNAENNGMIIVDRIGLKVGKTYKATGYYGGESLDSDIGATRFELTATAVDGAEFVGVEDTSMILFEKLVSEEYSGTINIAVYDGVIIDITSGDPIADSSKSLLMFGYSGGDGGRPNAKNLVVESIVENI